jgi:5'-3' exonuclease
MGVPRLFPWIQRNFKKHILHFQQGESSHTVDALYLDANPLLHSATQFVNNTVEGKFRFLDVYKNLSEHEKMLKAFELFFDNIVELTEIVIPKKILYIAIDGPAPRAKQNQQRERRFVSAKIRLEKEGVLEDHGSSSTTSNGSSSTSSKKIFNSSSLTPGTLFMHSLMKYINYSIRRQMTINDKWRNLEVYFSSCSSPGEGEHKCLDFIRRLPKQQREEYEHCIFGPDGDLIMLTMSAHVPKILLFREDLYTPGYYHILNMGEIVKELPRVLSLEKGFQAKKRYLANIVDDFIVEGFFVGNDFLPKIQMFHLLEDGLELMIKTYAETSNYGMTNPLTVDGILQLQGFKLFLKKLSTYEEKYLVNQIIEPNPKKQPPEEKFVNHTLKDCLIDTFDPFTNSGSFGLNLNLYRKKYYLKSFDDEYNSVGFDQKVKEMCRCYLKSFIWILKYYVFGLASWGWAYEYHYAPVMTDFNKYVSSLTEEEFMELQKFEKGEPALPFEQLLSVLPTASRDLLPIEYAKLMIDKSSLLFQKNYYPPLETLRIDYEGKLREHEGVVLLPFVDYKDIHLAYEMVSSALNSKIYHRNLQGKYPSIEKFPLSLFKYNPSKTINYKNEFGSLENIPIRKTLLLI